MTEPTDSEKPSRPSNRRAYGTGFAVFLLYVFFVAAVFAGFASYLTRTHLEADFHKVTENTRGLDDLIYLLKREAVLQRQIDATLDLVREADARIDAAKATISGIEANHQRAQSQRNTLAIRTLVHVRRGQGLWEADSAAQISKALEDPELPDDLARMRAILTLVPALAYDAEAEADAVSALRGHLSAAQTELDTLDARLREIGQELLTRQSDLDRALEARSWPNKQRDQFERELNALRAREPADSSNRARVSALAQLYGGQFFLELVSMPTIFLTLIVTMAAGGLGTVVSYTRSLQSPEREAARKDGETLFVDDLSRLFVGVGEGIAAALAIFLLAGAGMLVLTNGSGSPRNAEISPYTVAFIAFLSGFMAEHAFVRIQKTGKELFANAKGKKQDGA
ncbi:hypothetical protein PGB28_10670 [Primorskyibacter aestuariivivens]|uniref:hypothetical protein n=1 Tax=Primorskyibacter aestuariivivens TaxID=1888912 RepID=UPI002301003D|nr:hypothetical protein [Primorskyibacter aestuariivivens]MDA7428921.1 hypothetical protein [Primorskyibacter aestuariivivens]